MLSRFLDTYLSYESEKCVLFADFYRRFQNFLPPDERIVWTRRKVTDALPNHHRTIHRGQNKIYVRNIAWREEPPKTFLDRFLAAACVAAVGESIPFKAFYSRFLASLPPGEWRKWSRIRVAKALPPKHRTVKQKNNSTHVGDIKWK